MGTKDISEDCIATAAYFIWLGEGRPDGMDDAHWHRARAELESAAETPKRSARKTTKTGKAGAASAPGARPGEAKAPRRSRKTTARS